MNNFPKNLMEFEEWLATEEACVEYLRKFKWPEGFRCAVCKGSKSWPLKNRRVEECAGCGHQDRRPSAVGFMIYKRSAFRGLRPHRVINLKEQAPTAKLFSRIHKVFLLIRRTVLGTFHGSLSRKYLQAYLNEFEFRFNRRNADSRWLLFGRVLQAAPCARGLSLRELIERAGATT
jgi:hypothetical protein